MEYSFASACYNSSVIYRIYPKSFFDSDGDGIGDLKGIVSKLPYFVSLGVDTLALTSFLETDSDSALFSVTDFCRINPALGSMDDFEDLLEKAHNCGIKIFLSFPIAATSSSHPWFEKSKSATTLNPYREYYVWRAGRGKNPPDTLKTRFKTPVWSHDGKSGEWFRCFYNEKYPELNYDNPRVRKEIVDVFRFWRQKQVDGFMIENLAFSTEKMLLRDQKTIYTVSEDLFDDGKLIFRVLRDVKEKVEEDFPIILCTEGVDFGLFPYLLQKQKPIADSLVNGALIAGTDLITHSSFSLKDFVKSYLAIQESVCAPSLTLAFEDKDHSRLVSELAKVADETHPFAAKFLCVLLFCAQTTPCIFQGEEIGMSNFVFSKKDARPGVDPALFHARSPFQWDNNPNAAFTDAEVAYFPANANYHKINLLTQMDSQDSIFAFYRKMIAFRKASSALSIGKFTDYSQGSLVCFVRSSDSERLLVIANASAKHQNANTPAELLGESAVCEICNYPIVSKTLNKTMGLRPYEVRIFRLKAPLLALN